MASKPSLHTASNIASPYGNLERRLQHRSAAQRPPGLDKYFQAEAAELAKGGRLRGASNVDWSKVLVTDFLPK